MYCKVLYCTIVYWTIRTYLLANSLVEWTSVFETCVCSDFFVSKFSHFYTVQYSNVLYCNVLSWPVSRHQINTCTVLYFSVLYCIKIRKFADKQTRNDRFKNWSPLYEGVGQYQVNVYLLRCFYIFLQKIFIFTINCW